MESLLPKHILVVDDEEDVREFLRIALEHDGYSVTTAANGALALQRLAAEVVDVVLLDMRMPVMDGWAFAEAYHRLPGPHVPIVVLTAAQDAATRARQIGAEAYLPKPFDLDDILDIVARYTRD